jgi:hypothetical protein
VALHGNPNRLFIFGTVFRNFIPYWLPGKAGFVLPCFCLVYYCLRGYVDLIVAPLPN